MKLSKRIISILLALCCVIGGMITVAAEGETGSTTVWNGTRDTSWYNDTAKVFYIYTAEQLAGLAKLVNEGNTFAGKTVILESDVVLYSGNAEDWKTAAPSDVAKDSGHTYGWTPIGYKDEVHYSTSDTPKAPKTTVSFKGTFDGNGHTVSGIYYSRVEDIDATGTTNAGGLGLFGFVNGAEIKRVRVENSYLNGNLAIGGIVGYAVSSTISDCYSNAIIEASNNKDDAWCGYGGIVGIGGHTNPITVTGCWFAGEIYNDDNRGISGGFAVGSGGIIGTLNKSNNLIENCLVTGSIDGVTMVGGIVGKCNANANPVSIKNTLMLGEVQATRNNASVFAGEIIGIVMGAYTASAENVYGKAGFAMTFAFTGTLTKTQPGYAWSTNGTGMINGLNQADGSHRLDNAGLKALVGKKLSVGEWAVVDGYDYPVPAYFAPAQFMGVQFAGLGGDNYNVRFVGTIADPENYNAVGFEVVLWDGESANAMLYELDGATVYTSILASTESGIVEEVSVDGMYLIALTIEDVPAEYTTYQIRTFVLDGANKIYGKTVTMTNTDVQ